MAKKKVTKHRDQLRLGYAHIKTTNVYDYNPTTGAMELQHSTVICNGSGDQKCRNNNAFVLQTELDEFTDLTVAEKAIAQQITNNGENNIDNGVANGNLTETHQFMNLSGVSYFRTFTYSWITNTTGEIFSEINITDKF